MTPLSLLVALLAVAYVGGFLRDAEHRRSFGWSSGVEFVLLGLVMGPHVLGLVSTTTVVGFEPILMMIVGWLLAVQGTRHGRVFSSPVGLRRYVLGTALAIASGVLLFAGVYLSSRYLLPEMGERDRLLLTLGLTAVGVGTTDQALRWLNPRSVSSTSRSRLLAELGNVDDLFPVLLLAGLVILTPPETSLPLPGWAWGLISIGLGVTLGGTVAALLGRHLGEGEGRAVLLGGVFFTVGLSLRLNLPIVTSAFVLGLTLAILSPYRGAIRKHVDQTERPLLLPALLLVGALTTVPVSVKEAYFVGTIVGLRVVIQLSFGWLLSLRYPTGGVPGAPFGLCLLPASSASLLIGLTLVLRHPGTVGRLVLLAAVAVNLAGELLGSRALRRLLEHEQADALTQASRKSDPGELAEASS